MTNVKDAQDHRSADPEDPVFLHTLGVSSHGYQYHGSRGAAPASGVFIANRLQLYPIWIAKPYNLKRWYWLNGATVGTDYISECLYDQNFELVAASKRVLSAGTASQLQYAGATAVNAGNVIAAGSAVDGDTYTTASVTLHAGRLYLLCVFNSHATNAPAVSSIDNGPTFTSRSTTQFNGTTARLTILSAVPTADYTGTLVINFGTSSGVTGALWSLDAIYGADTTTNDGIVQNATGTGNSTLPAATLGAFGSTDNATYGCNARNNTAGSAVNAGWVEFSDSSIATPAYAIASYFRSDNDTAADLGTITSGQWGACAVEIKASTASKVIQPGRYYLGLHASGTTATAFRSTSNANLAVGYYYKTSQTTGLPQTATGLSGPGANPWVPVIGFTRRASP